MKASSRIKLDNDFSRGCRSCQQGRWLCIFLTYLCGADCSFCPAPFKHEDRIVSAFGDNPEKILQHLAGGYFNSISFSGGEVFLVFDRLVDWLTFFKGKRPDMYYWAYTSGLPADDDKMAELARIGLNEIRFNTAATGYDSPFILDKISAATRIFEKVAVEIPSIPADYQKVIDVLPALDHIGVDYLNLHEYILVDDDPQTSSTESGTFILNKNINLRYDIASRKNTKKIMDFCRKHRLRMKVNNCSLQKKENQMLHRRLVFGKIFRREYEHLTADGLLETCLIYPSRITFSQIKRSVQTQPGLAEAEKYFVNPAELSRAKARQPNGTSAKLTFLPPMGIDDKRAILYVKILD